MKIELKICKLALSPKFGVNTHWTQQLSRVLNFFFNVLRVVIAILYSDAVTLKYFIYIAPPIEGRKRNLTKYILARVCTLNMCGYSKLLRSVQ